MSQTIEKQYICKKCGKIAFWKIEGVTDLELGAYIVQHEKTDRVWCEGCNSSFAPAELEPVKELGTVKTDFI